MHRSLATLSRYRAPIRFAHPLESCELGRDTRFTDGVPPVRRQSLDGDGVLTLSERLFKILNMRSMESSDDRTTSARIRDAAIRCFATHGVAATSVRAIAAEAGVSAGLVIHHFGSKDQLRIACDEYVAALIREVKGSAMAAGAGLDPLAAMRSFSGGPPMARYLAKTLVDGSPHVADLVEEMVNDAVGYIATGVKAGLLTPSDHPKERAAILTLWMLGALVLHEHLERLIGFDITGDFTEDPEGSGSGYFGAVTEILGGIFTDTTKELMGEAFSNASVEEKADTEELA